MYDCGMKWIAYIRPDEQARIDEMSELIKGFAKERRRIFDRLRKRAAKDVRPAVVGGER